MNTTFNKEDDEQAMAADDIQPYEDAPEELEPSGASETSQSHPPANTTFTRGKEETLLGFNRCEIIAMKHSSKLLAEQLGRLLFSPEFEVRRCATGEIISEGRCSHPINGQANGVGGRATNEEMEQLIRERDAARAEAEKLHTNYVTLYDTYNQVKSAANDIRSEYESARDKLKMAANECEEWSMKFMAIKQNATDELQRASIEYEDLVKKHIEDTKGLQLRVQRQVIEMRGKDEEVESLKKRNAELSSICDQLMEDVELSDRMSMVSMDA